MTTIQRVCSAWLGCAWLAACGSADGERRPPPPPIEETVFRDVVTPMDKARNVENVTMEHKQALDRSLQQNEDGGEQ